MNRLETDAWLLRGISSLPGELRLASGRLSFVCSGSGSARPFQIRRLAQVMGQPCLVEAIAEGRAVPLFVWPADQVETVFPWYYFGGGLKLRYRGVQLRFSFGRPASPGYGLGAAASDLKEAATMRSRGKLWSKALARCRVR